MWVGFAKRVGCANMHHDGVAKRDLSWAWMSAMRWQVRRAREREVHDPRESTSQFSACDGRCSFAATARYSTKRFAVEES